MKKEEKVEVTNHFIYLSANKAFAADSYSLRLKSSVSSRTMKNGYTMDLTVITEQEIASRRYWIDEISRLSGNFGVDSDI